MSHWAIDRKPTRGVKPYRVRSTVAQVVRPAFRRNPAAAKLPPWAARFVEKAERRAQNVAPPAVRRPRYAPPPIIGPRPGQKWPGPPARGWPAWAPSGDTSDLGGADKVVIPRTIPPPVAHERPINSDGFAVPQGGARADQQGTISPDGMKTGGARAPWSSQKKALVTMSAIGAVALVAIVVWPRKYGRRRR